MIQPLDSFFSPARVAFAPTWSPARRNPVQRACAAGLSPAGPVPPRGIDLEPRPPPKVPIPRRSRRAGSGSPILLGGRPGAEVAFVRERPQHRRSPADGLDVANNGGQTFTFGGRSRTDRRRLPLRRFRAGNFYEGPSSKHDGHSPFD